jgi:hypothetical protein
MNISSRPTTIEDRVPYLFSIELVPFNEGMVLDLDTRFLFGNCDTKDREGAAPGASPGFHRDV